MRGRTRTTAITADPHTPVMTSADEVVVLDFADELSVVQTRFATTAVTLLRAHLGLHTDAVVADARTALTAELPQQLVACSQFTFLGRGWTVGLANEAGLKMREASLSWTEAYPAMEYRHGPISITTRGTATWMLGEAPRDSPNRWAPPAGCGSTAASTRWPNSSAPSASPSPSPPTATSTPTARATSPAR